MSINGGVVADTLKYCNTRHVPRGELFIYKDFLDFYFAEYKTDYVKQLDGAAHSLALSAIGIDLSRKESQIILGHSAFNQLEEYYTIGCINGPVAGLINRHGFCETMLSMRKNPSLLKEAGEALAVDVERLCILAAVDKFKAVAITDDIAGNQGLFFSPIQFTDLFLPVYQKLATIIKDHGMATFFHSDGDMRPVLGALANAGYDCVHPVDVQAGITAYDLRDSLGERLCFMGNIDILAWSEERIAEEAHSSEKAFSKGGLIIGSTGGISMDTAEKLGALYPEWKDRR